MIRILLALILICTSSVSFAQTNTTTISGLPQATTPLTGAEFVPLVQGGVTKHVTTSQLTSQADGTVKTVSCGTGATGLSCSVANPTVSPIITLNGSLNLNSIASISANTILGSAVGGTPVALPIQNCSGPSSAITWTAGSGWGCNSISSTTGTVTSVAMTMDGVVFNSSVGGSPITSNGTFVPTLKSVGKNLFLAGPVTGSNALWSARAIAGEDLPLPTISKLGGVMAKPFAANSYLTSINTDGSVGQAQPSFTEISGTLNLVTQVSGVLGVSNGGTGLSSSGANGNCLVSNGTSWTSSACGGGGGGGTITIGSSLSAANPQVSNHANSGLYSAGTDVETIIGGSSIQSVSSSGVGIKTTSPSSTLDVFGSSGAVITIDGPANTNLDLYFNGGGANFWQFFKDSGNNWGVWDNTRFNNAILFQPNGNSYLSEGNLTVGATSVSAVNKLEVNGSIAVGTSYSGVIAPTNGAIIQGSVGIGTSSATSNLTVIGSSSVSGVAYFADGTTSLPSIAFSGDTTTGFSRSNTHNINVSLAGVNTFDFSTGGLFDAANASGVELTSSAASSTSPTIRPNRSASTTGIGAASAGTVSIIASAIDILDIGSTSSNFVSGKVGIGSSNPIVSLDLSQKTDALSLPSGTTGTRPSPATNGMLRYNSTTPAVEAYANNVWTSLGSGSGGTINLGTSSSATNPQRTSEAGTGLYSTFAGALQMSNTVSSVTYPSFYTGGTITNGSGTFNTWPVTTRGDVLLGLGAGTAMTINSTCSPGNVAIGHYAMNAFVNVDCFYTTNNFALGGSGVQNVAIGDLAMGLGAGASGAATSTRTGSYNTAVGYAALETIGSSSSGLAQENTAVGETAGQTCTGCLWNSFLGTEIEDLAASGNYAFNVGVGSDTLQHNTGNSNVAVGFAALSVNTTGSNNVAIGSSVASVTLTTGSNNILIGTNSNVDTPAAGTNNFLNIGNGIFGTGLTGTLAAPAGRIGIGTATPAEQFHLYGAFTASPQLFIQNTTTTDYTDIGFQATGKQWLTGVGNASETTVGVANKYFVYNASDNVLAIAIGAAGYITTGGPVQVGGTKYTTSGAGCTVASPVGGCSAGSFIANTTGTCTTTITFCGATGATATNGWTCNVRDISTNIQGGDTTTGNTTSQQIAVATTSGNTVKFSCVPY